MNMVVSWCLNFIIFPRLSRNWGCPHDPLGEFHLFLPLSLCFFFRSELNVSVSETLIGLCGFFLIMTFSHPFFFSFFSRSYVYQEFLDDVQVVYDLARLVRSPCQPILDTTSAKPRPCRVGGMEETQTACHQDAVRGGFLWPVHFET